MDAGAALPPVSSHTPCVGTPSLAAAVGSMSQNWCVNLLWFDLVPASALSYVNASDRLRFSMHAYPHAPACMQHLDRAVVPLRRVLRPSTMTRASATLDATASTRLPRGATATPIALLSDESRIQLFYRSSWEGARVHGSLKGAPWVDFPLKQVNVMPVSARMRAGQKHHTPLSLLLCRPTLICQRHIHRIALQIVRSHPRPQTAGCLPTYHCSSKKSRMGMHHCLSLW